MGHSYNVGVDSVEAADDIALALSHNFQIQHLYLDGQTDGAIKITKEYYYRALRP